MADKERTARPPRDNIVRANRPAVEFRSATDGSELSGHFSVFNAWYEVDSLFEGHFLERVVPGAFKKTFAENRDAMRVTFNHGQDSTMGNQVLGPIEQLSEDDTGAYYNVRLLDGIPPLLLAGLREGVYGSSFRFRVVKDDFDPRAKPSAHNPDGIPERTIREVDVYEFGPVTFPASPSATAQVRSLTDAYVRQLFTGSALADGADASHSADASRDDPPVVEPPPQVAAAIETTETRHEGGSSDSQETPDVDTPYISREDKVSRAAELKEAIARQAGAFPGVLPEDEQTRWDADNAELDILERDIAAVDARKAIVERFAKDETKVERTAPNQINRKSDKDVYSPETRSTSFEGRMGEYRDDAMRIVENTRSGSLPQIADEARTRDRLAYLLDHCDSPDKELARRIKYTGSPVYMRAFEKIIKAKGQTFGLTPEEQRGTALAVGVDATGGFAVPFAFDPTVIAIGVNNGAVNPYRRVCRVVSIVGTDTWNAITATAVTATRTTEAAASIEQGPTLAQPQYIVKRAQGQITASFEMFQDRADLASEMTTLINEAKDNEEETSWATGAGAASASLGVGPVSGTSGAYTAVATAGSAVIAAGDADATEAALPVRHRFGAQWFMNRLNIRKFQAVETTGGKLFGGSIYFPGVGQADLSRDGNTGLRLLGYPVNESPSLPTATTTTITIGTLLNPQSYVIVDRVGLSVQFIPFIFNSSALATGQQALYFLYRNHAAPLNLDGGRTLRFV